MTQYRSLQSWLDQFMLYMMSPFSTYAEVMNGIKEAAPGDPMYGKAIPDTTYNWNDMTQLQQAAWQWFSVNSTLSVLGIQKGEPADANLQQVLQMSLGPNIPANWSYNRWKQNGLALP